MQKLNTPTSLRSDHGYWGKLCLVLLAILKISTTSAQFTYTFSAVSGSYTQVSAGGSDLNSIEVDDQHSASIPLGFAFGYNGLEVTTIRVNSNGWISMDVSDSPSAAQGRDNSSFGAANSNVGPGIMPLWDDLDGASGTARYETTGSAGSRVFTMEWRNWQWNYQASGSTISFECKLYEGTNVIEFIYRQESGSVNTGSGGASIGLLASASESGNYYSLNNASASPTASTSAATTNITTKPATGQIYRFTPSGCSGPSISGTTSNSPICTGSTLNLTATATGTAPLFYSWSGTGTFSNTTISNPTVTGAATGTYSVTVRNWCGATTNGNTSVTVTPAPTTSAAGPDQSFCSSLTSSATLAANSPSVGTAAWSIVSVPAGASNSLAQFSSTTATNATFTPSPLVAGAYTLRWTISNSPCTASTDNVVVTWSAPPATANAGADQSICVSGTATLAANSASPGTGAWTILAGSPSTSSSQFSNTSLPTAVFDPSGGAGTYTLRWTTSNAPCAFTQDDVVINVDALPTTANAGSDQTICPSLGSATMTGNTPGIGTGAWSQVSGPLSATITTTTLPNAVTSGMTTAGTYVFEWTTTNGTCSSNDQMNVIVSPPPTMSVSGLPGTICSNGSATLSAVVTAPISFTSSASSGALNLNLPNFSATLVTNALPISGGFGTVGSDNTISVTLNATTGSAQNNNLDFYLIGPANCGVMELSTDNGGSGDNYAGALLRTPSGFTNINTLGNVSNISGNFSPEGNINAVPNPASGIFGASYAIPGTALAGCPVNGSWTIAVGNDNLSNSATFTGWSLTIEKTLAGNYTHAFSGPGSISGVTASGANNATGTVTVSGPPTGLQSYTIQTTSPVTGCTTTNTVNINVIQAPNAGSNGTLTLCSIDPAASLFAQLGGTPDAGGTWSGPSTVVGGMYDPATMVPGTYTYTVTGTAPCANANATVTVTENTATTWYADADNDGAGDPTAATVVECDQPVGFVASNNDLCPTDGSKINPGQCGCGNADTDTDGDLTADCNDLCPLDPNKIAPGTCGCGIADTDTDGDLTADCNDLCPLDANKIAPGACGCGVADVVTTYYADADGDGFGDPADALSGFTCITPAGYVSDNTDLCPADANKQDPGACGCGVADVPVICYADPDGDGFGSGDPIPTFTCNIPSGHVINNGDLCPLDPNKINPGQCGCGNPDTDTDGDLTADCNDLCPLDPNKIAPGQCGCGNLETDSDNDGLADCVDACPLDANNDQDGDGICGNVDSCPTLFGQNGDICDANPGPGYTLGQITGCACVQATCTINLTLEFQTDANPNQISWEVRQQGTNTLVQSGGQLVAPNGIQTQNTCLPNGCYYLKVLDSGGDGITNGGYILRTAGSPGVRIIDNRLNFTSGAVSQIAGGEGFCVPMSAAASIFTSCDKLDWTTGEYYVCSPVAAVSAEYSGPNAATSGYEFWIFNPNGGYSFRKFRSHTVSDGFAPADASRACHLKINNWAAANQIPANVLMNVKVRTRINNVNGSWGSACRMMIDPVRAACPLTKLMDIPGNPYFSCNVMRSFVTGQYVHARPVTGANKYQFRFRIDGENFVTIRNSNTYFVQLNWTVQPLQDGKTYQVEVRASKDNGATWCIDTPTPAAGPNFTPWGEVCDLTIDNTPVSGGGQNMVSENTALRMYPNPNHGDQLYLSLDAVKEGVLTVSVDIYDLYGTRVSIRTIPVQDAFINTVIDLDGNLASGMYLVNITAGEEHYTERLVIQK